MDLISRQAAIKQILLCENHDMEHDYEFNNGLIVAANTVAELPTAEPRKGKWVKTVTAYPYCSECDWMPEEDEMTHGFYRYCPWCGARMEES